jgi:hypothetical protein
MLRWLFRLYRTGPKGWVILGLLSYVFALALAGFITVHATVDAFTSSSPMVTHTPVQNHNASSGHVAGASAAVLGASTRSVGHSNNTATTNSNASAVLNAVPSQNSLSKSLVNYPYAPQVADSGHLEMTPNTIIWGNVISPLPDLVMSNHLEISQPTNNSSPDISLSWYNDGNGHYSPGPYYVGWRPFLQLLHPIMSDGSTVFNVTAQDRDGNSYSTTLKVVWLAPRSLGMTMGSVDKQVQGNNIVYTGHVLFSPTSNVGNPSVHITANGNVNGTDPCDVSETSTTFTYTGQSSYDVSCVISADNLKNYPSGFDVYVNASTQWPPLSPVTYPAQFHAD